MVSAPVTVRCSWCNCWRCNHNIVKRCLWYRLKHSQIYR